MLVVLGGQIGLDKDWMRVRRDNGMEVTPVLLSCPGLAKVMMPNNIASRLSMSGHRLRRSSSLTKGGVVRCLPHHLSACKARASQCRDLAAQSPSPIDSRGRRRDIYRLCHRQTPAFFCCLNPPDWHPVYGRLQDNYKLPSRFAGKQTTPPARRRGGLGPPRGGRVAFRRSAPQKLSTAPSLAK